MAAQGRPRGPLVSKPHRSQPGPGRLPTKRAAYAAQQVWVAARASRSLAVKAAALTPPTAALQSLPNSRWSAPTHPPAAGLRGVPGPCWATSPGRPPRGFCSMAGPMPCIRWPPLSPHPITAQGRLRSPGSQRRGPWAAPVHDQAGAANGGTVPNGLRNSPLRRAQDLPPAPKVRETLHLWAAARPPTRTPPSSTGVREDLEPKWLRSER